MNKTENTSISSIIKEEFLNFFEQFPKGNYHICGNKESIDKINKEDLPYDFKIITNESFDKDTIYIIPEVNYKPIKMVNN